MRPPLLILFFLFGCGYQKKEPSQHPTVEEIHLHANNACLTVGVTKSSLDTVIYLDKKTSIDSFQYVACGDQLLNNLALLDSIRSLHPVKKIGSGHGDFIDLLFLKTLSTTERQVDFGFYPVVNYKNKKKVMKPYLFRYVKPTHSFYITEHPDNEYIFMTMEQWMNNDSLMSQVDCGGLY
ncbi:hypothetical protein [Cesiribacter andamanensis]|uniref:Uncharacterized protein n=1 Tax=Cesiribacter andamanensis AMV16 TaxID=1279009 RepID=M7NI75_9BACT|nr:hypothetical protein [Cesiribacter andamanensis]EMR01505.1 hypothetical protein ADICEAN_03362 [Cesiribacter andamanensis AMV16]